MAEGRQREDDRNDGGRVGRIVYICNWNGHSGGIKVIYEHVRLLRRLRFDAWLGSYGEFRRCTWFKNDEQEAPAISAILGEVRADDLLVIPDVCLDDERIGGLPARKVALIQNAALLPERRRRVAFEAVLTPSRPLAAKLRMHSGIDVPIHFVPGFLESEYLFPRVRDERGWFLPITFDRPGKNAGEPRLVQEALKRHGLEILRVESPAAPHVDFVGAFRQYDAYLHLSHPEGFPGPVIEAFGSGALVIGFTGVGGAEFMRDGDNCLVCPDGDWRNVVETTLRVWRLDSATWNRLIANALRTAASYSEAKTSAALAQAFEALARSRSRRIATA